MGSVEDQTVALPDRINEPWVKIQRSWSQGYASRRIGFFQMVHRCPSGRKSINCNSDPSLGRSSIRSSRIFLFQGFEWVTWGRGVCSKGILRWFGSGIKRGDLRVHGINWAGLRSLVKGIVRRIHHIEWVGLRSLLKGVDRRVNGIEWARLRSLVKGVGRRVHGVEGVGRRSSRNRRGWPADSRNRRLGWRRLAADSRNRMGWAEELGQKG